LFVSATILVNKDEYIIERSSALLSQVQLAIYRITVLHFYITIRI